MTMTKQGTYSNETLQMLNALGARPIAYHPAFARAWGVKAAILLGQLIYWHGKQSNTDGWIRKTVAEIDEETALSEKEQETARRVLIAEGALEYARFGVPAMPHYRINHAEIVAALTSKSAQQDRTEVPNQLGQNGLSSQAVSKGNLIGQNGLSVQEITTKNTSEITSEDAEGAPNAGNNGKLDLDALAREKGIHNQRAPRKRKSAAPPAQTAITQEMLSHFAVSAHREIISVLLDAFCAEQIIGRVTDEARWREVLTDWRLHPAWKRDNIAGQLDRYDNWPAIKAQAQGAPPLKHPQPQVALTGAAKVAQETFDRQQRGMARALEYLNNREVANGNA
jgi:hypothetical protein